MKTLITTEYIRTVAIFALLLTLSFSPSGVQAEKLKLEDTVAIVDGRPIPAGELLTKSRLAARVRESSFERLPFYDADSLQYQFLDGLIDQYMLENYHGPEICDEARKEAIQLTEAYASQFKSEYSFHQHLKGMGINQDIYTWQAYKRILLEKAAAEGGLSAHVLTKDELIRTYEENPERLKIEAQARIELLVINPKPSAPNPPDPDKIRTAVLDARQLLIEEKPFDEVATHFSDNHADIEAGGARMTVKISEISPSLRDFIFREPVNTWSPALPYGPGYATIRVLERRTDGKPSIQELQQSLYDELVASPWNETLERFRRQMRQKTDTEVYLGQRSLRDSEGETPGNPQILILSLLLLATGAVVYFTRHWHGWPRATVFIFILGMALRLTAWYATPFDIRAQDAASHIEYIEEVKKGNWLPAADQGFMFYQPPLYYWLASLLPESSSYHHLQIFSLILSWTALAAALWSLSCCWTKKGSFSWHRHLFEGLVATIPILIFFAPRINNDVLATVFLFLIFGLIVRWWKTGESRYWWLTAFFCGLGLLTKNTLLPLGPVVLLSLFLHSRLSLKNRLVKLSGGAAIVLIMVGWLWLSRHGGEGISGLVSNLDQLSQQQKFEPTAGKLLSVNPFRLIGQPFLISWFKSDEREFFIEYALRSALFTQFYHPGFPKWLGSGVMAIALTFLGLALFKAYRFTRESWKEVLPFVSTILSVALAHLLLVVNAPYIASFNFRYSVVLILPLFYLACRPSAENPKWLERVSLAIAALMIPGFLASVVAVLLG